MKAIQIIACAAALALAACGQTTEAPPEAPPPPASLMEQVQAMPPENQPVFAYQQLVAYQQANPDSQPPCTAVRSSDSRGVIPPNIDPNSPYGPHVGSAVYSVQCGALVSMTQMDPREHWLVIFAPGATEVQVVNCAGANGRDACPRTLPIVEVGPTPTP